MKYTCLVLEDRFGSYFFCIVLVFMEELGNVTTAYSEILRDLFSEASD